MVNHIETGACEAAKTSKEDEELEGFKWQLEGLESPTAARSHAKAEEYEQKKQDARTPPYIHMDAMAFGMGCCCLQVCICIYNNSYLYKV